MKKMIPETGSTLAALRNIFMHRKLIKSLTERDVVGRYRGSLAGLAWSLLNPLIMLAVYVFVFSTIFGARWASSEELPRKSFAVILFVGTLIHGLFAESVNRAPFLIVGNVNYVKKVVFPLEVLPVVNVGSSIFHASINLVVLLCATMLVFGKLSFAVVSTPLILLPVVLIALTLGWLISALGVYLRDIEQVTGLLTTVMMFLSPVFYPATALPPQMRHLLYLNPLTFPIEQARGAIIWGVWPDWSILAVYILVSSACAAAGLWIFQRLRSGFADVL